MTRTLFLLGLCVISAVCAQIFLKLGLNRHGPIEALRVATVLATIRNPFVMAGIGCYLVSGLFWLIALSRLDLSVAYPLLTLSVVGVAWASTVFLGERMTVPRVIGTLLTLGGAWLVFRR